MNNTELMQILCSNTKQKRVVFIFEWKMLDIDSFHSSDDFIIKLWDCKISLDEYHELLNNK